MSGIFGFKNLNLDINRIKIELLHNQPDNFNYNQLNNITFCQSQIQICPKEQRRIPIESNCSLIAFNGEIYNKQELIREYLKNVEIRTNTDTEILLKLLEKYGLKALNKINGMFAFAYYDNKSESTFLVNDRFGIKQLFYYANSNSFAFSSEDSILCRMLNFPFSFNQSYIKSLFIENILDFENKLMNKNIHSVHAGEYVEITKNNEIKKGKYYNFNDFNTKDLGLNYKNKKEIINYFENLLTDAIKLRTQENNSIAMTLSGGIDSTTIYTLAKENLNLEITAFSYCNANKNKNEYETAEKLTRKYNDKIVKIEYDKTTFEENYKKALIALNAPCCFSDANYYSIYKKMNEMKFKIVIEGHGSDEILGGYPSVCIHAAKQAISQRKLILALHILNFYKINQEDKMKSKEIIKLLLNIPESKKDIFLENINYLIKMKPLPIVLRYWDRITVDNSVELRTPFLDYRVVEFARALPLEYKINRIGNKAILREILKKYKTDFIYKNKIKRGFTTSEDIISKEQKSFLLKYYDQNRFNLDISNFDNNMYKACSVGFLENYYKGNGI